MDEIESYVVALTFTAIAGFFSGGARKYLQLDKSGALDNNLSPWKKLTVLICGMASTVYAFLWAFSINHKLLVMLPFVLAYFSAGYISDSFYGPNKGWKVSAFGLVFIPTTYHFISPHITQIYALPWQ